MPRCTPRTNLTTDFLHQRFIQRDAVRQLHKQHHLDVAFNGSPDHDGVRHFIHGFHDPVNLRRSDSDPARIQCRIASTGNSDAALFGEHHEVAVMPHPRELLEIRASVFGLRLVVPPKTEWHGWERLFTDQLPHLVQNRLPIRVVHLHRHA